MLTLAGGGAQANTGMNPTRSAIASQSVGLVLLVTPNVLLGLFSVPATTDVWIRVVGRLLLYLGFY